MKIISFLSHYRHGADILERIKTTKLGIVFVGNGIYHVGVSENGKPSPLLDKKDVSFYALIDDIETRGFKIEGIDKRVKPVSYEDLVDLIFNEYEKVIWL
ncbi:MAG: DsrH/TusB family sulfur relay protein [Thermodesulfovibrionales bacterium]|nr:DsrH/TusB family sulfur relay protein [Thermodesulfovibrionales bacterium]